VARRAPAAASVVEGEGDRRPTTQRVKPGTAAGEGKAERRPTTARVRVGAKPLWQTKPFIYASAAGGFLLLVIVVLLLSRGGKRPALAQASPVVPKVSAVTEPAAKETKGKSDVAKVQPKTSTPVPRPVEPPPPPKPPDPPPKKRWQAVKGTAAGTETYEEFLKRTKDLQIYSFEDYVVKWEYAGPYPGPNNAEKCGPFDVEFPPEKQGEAPTWAPMPVGSDTTKPWLFDFHKTPEIARTATEHAAIYLRTRIHSPTRQQVQIWAGSDDSIKIWLNGQIVHSNRKDRACKADEDKKDVTLNDGWNDLMVKIGQGGGEWGFCLRFRTRDGKKVSGLTADPAGK